MCTISFNDVIKIMENAWSDDYVVKIGRSKKYHDYEEAEPNFLRVTKAGDEIVLIYKIWHGGKHMSIKKGNPYFFYDDFALFRVIDQYSPKPRLQEMTDSEKDSLIRAFQSAKV